MEEYKKSVDGQHAPEALITQTLQRIHEEERRQSGECAEENVVVGNGGKRRRRSLIVMAAGMAAALAIVIGVSGSRSSLYYNPVPESLVRGITENGSFENEMDVDAYSAYLGVDMTAVPENTTLIKANISVSYAADGIQVTEDEGTFYYNADGNQVMVKVSGTKEVAPEELLLGEVSQWHNMTVYAGEDETSGQRLAAITQGNIHYFVMSYNMTEKEFEKFLKNFF